MSNARHHPLGLLVAGALAIGSLSAGCGDSSEDTATTAAPKTVDDAQVEQGLTEELSTSTTDVAKAQCPSDVTVKQGNTFTCSVTYDNDASGKVTVTQQGGNQYTYALKPGSVQVTGATANAAVEKSLAAQGFPGATVTCPENIIVKVGTTVTCDVSGGEQLAAGSVTFTFSDAEGTVDTASVEA